MTYVEHVIDHCVQLVPAESKTLVRLRMHFDGGSRNNPGKAGSGAILHCGQKKASVAYPGTEGSLAHAKQKT